MTIEADTFSYFTVSGFDYTGRSVTVTSEAVTIDSSVPILTGTDIKAKFAYSPDTTLQLDWDGVFTDPESSKCFSINIQKPQSKPLFTCVIFLCQDLHTLFILFICE